MKPKIIKSFLVNNDCYKAGRQIRVEGLMLHSVGCPQPSASVFVSSWNRPGIKACVHAFIDAQSGDIYQTLPWNHRGWHGGGSSNNSYIGVEMCEPDTIRYTRGASFMDKNPSATKATVLRTYQVAIQLFAMLCVQYNLDPRKDGVILSHSEGYHRGISTNHGDPEHLWRCFGLTMDEFRTAVWEAMKNGVSTEIQTISHSESPEVSFRVKVTADRLNIRTGPGTEYPISGQIADHGVYTVIQECYTGSGAWGKLKSGAGWIYLAYTERIQNMR